MLLEMDFCNALVLLYRDLRIFTKMFASVPKNNVALHVTTFHCVLRTCHLNFKVKNYFFFIRV